MKNASGPTAMFNIVLLASPEVHVEGQVSSIRHAKKVLCFQTRVASFAQGDTSLSI